jgi:hypothetical protein
VSYVRDPLAKPDQRAVVIGESGHGGELCGREVVQQRQDFRGKDGWIVVLADPSTHGALVSRILGGS